MSIVGYNLLNQIINLQKNTKPDEILNLLSYSLNNLLQTEGNQEVINDSMDIALCSINLNDLYLEYAGAHNPLYIFQNGKLIEIKGNGLSIGEKYNDNFIKYELKKFNLIAGDILYLFSDGYIDQFGGNDRKKFLSKRFKKLIIDNQHLDMENQKKALIDNFEYWKNDVEQYDDVMVLGFKISQNEINEKMNILNYKGELSFDKIEELLNITKEALNKIVLKNQIKKKIINILIDCLENIQKYSTSRKIDNMYLPEIKIVCETNSISISSKNAVDKKFVTKLKSHIDLINQLDRQSLKHMYEEIISNGNLSEKGGAGLGIIDIALKSGNKIDYSFSEIDNELNYFEMKIVINQINLT